ncbi:hypothetical protein EQV77_17595 [Halobacillus fulvus]|nr:hypothetical protein EQV77_17595 [Halobacillus fulvus]
MLEVTSDLSKSVIEEGKVLRDNCSICSKKTDRGLYLLQVYICHSCEKEMLKTPADDPKYQFFVDQMSKAQRSMTVS